MILNPRWNHNNKFCVLRLHYSSDPEKNTPEWKEQAQRGVSERSWNREYEIDYDTFEGQAVFEDFREDRHIKAFDYDPSIGIRVLRGWDFGFHRPAVTIAWMNEFDQLMVRKEILGHDEGIRDFGSRVIAICQSEFPNAKWVDACFVGETMVTTKTGHKMIKDIKSGDYVLTHKGNWKKVLKVIPKENKKLLYEVKINGSLANPIYCTKDHLFYSVKRRPKQYGNKYIQPEWNEAGDLTKSDQVFSPISKILNNSNYSDNEMMFFGIFLGDGSLITRDGKSQFIIRYAYDLKGKKIEKIIDDLAKESNIQLFKKFDKGYSVKVQRITFSDKRLSLIAKNLIRKNNLVKTGKKITNDLLYTNNEKFKKLLYGLYLTDGSISKNKKGSITYSNTSFELLKMIQLRLGISGIRSSFILKRKQGDGTILGRKVNQQNYYHLTISGTDNIENIFNQKYPICFENAVRTINSSKLSNRQDKIVYDLQVEDDHSFVVENISVHNCDPAGHQKTDKADFTSVEVLNSLGVYPTSKPSNIAEKLEIVRQRLLMRNDGRVGMFVHPDCTRLINGFKGGYRYPEEKEGVTQEQPLKDNYYDNIMDSLQYLCTNFLTVAPIPGQTTQQIYDNEITRGGSNIMSGSSMSLGEDFSS